MQFNQKLENCWICESWVECEFEINLVEALRNAGINQELRISENLDVHYHVYIHFDFDDYQPDRMDDLRKAGDFGGNFTL